MDSDQHISFINHYPVNSIHGVNYFHLGIL
jgi:hypothetical protein